MNGLQALNTLLEHAERERDDALTYVQRCEHNVRSTKAQHEQLIDYRRDYQQRWSAQFSQQGTMEIVSCYHGFVGRLSMAIDQQAQVAARAVTQLEMATAKLRDKEIRVASISKLMERRAMEAQRSADKRDQKMTDEMASRLAWNRIHGGAATAASPY